MKTFIKHRLTKQKEQAMDYIDVHDLPEEDARVIAAFVEFLRWRTQEQAVREAEAQGRSQDLPSP